MENENFLTRDLYLASALVTLGFPMLNVDLQIEGNNSRAIGYFNFEKDHVLDDENGTTLKEAMSEYNQGRILVEPRMYMNNLQSLKSTVVNMQKNPMSTFGDPK